MAAWETGLWACLPAIAAMPLYLVIHLAVWQVASEKWKGVAGLVMTAAVAYIVVFASCWIAKLLLSVTFWISLPLYAALVVLYMHLYFGIDRSLSVRILGELSRQPDGQLSFEELDAVYSTRDMVERRVAVLCEKGLLVEQDGVYRCTDKARLPIRFALVGKRLYNLSCTG